MSLLYAADQVTLKHCTLAYNRGHTATVAASGDSSVTVADSTVVQNYAAK